MIGQTKQFNWFKMVTKSVCPEEETEADWASEKWPFRVTRAVCLAPS